MSQLHYSDISLPRYPNLINRLLYYPLRVLLQPITHVYPGSIPELLVQIQKVTTPNQLTDALISLVHHASHASLRLEAAGWLRLFVQAAYPPHPEEIFVTLVTAAIRDDGDGNVQRANLKMIFECFWPFRYPYATYNWEKFPNNAVFYPLAPLLSHADACSQDILISIFAELPSLDDAEIAEYVLPFALKWSTDTNPERRQRITTILALMRNNAAQEALNRLQTDPHLLVSCKAKRAAEKVRRA